jgi:hypothetical protein
MRDCGRRKQVDEESIRESNLAAVPVFPAQVVRVYIPQAHSFSQANCNSIIDSDEPEAARRQAVSS